MDRMTIVRIVAVLGGAVVLFEMDQHFGIVYSIPAGVLAYAALRFGLSRLWGAGGKAT